MGLQRVLGLKSYTTAWTWLQKIRKAMVVPNRTKINGTVEADECYIGGVEHDGKRGRGATESKSIVVIGVELGEGKNQLGRVRMMVVPDVTEASLVDGFVKTTWSLEAQLLPMDGADSTLLLQAATHILFRRNLRSLIRKTCCLMFT